MREVILNYWNWFADLVNPYHDVINTISTIVIAAFAVVLARVAWKQTRDARILQRLQIVDCAGNSTTLRLKDYISQKIEPEYKTLPWQQDVAVLLSTNEKPKK